MYCAIVNSKKITIMNYFLKGTATKIRYKIQQNQMTAKQHNTLRQNQVQTNLFHTAINKRALYVQFNNLHKPQFYVMRLRQHRPPTRLEYRNSEQTIYLSGEILNLTFTIHYHLNPKMWIILQEVITDIETATHTNKML